MERGDHVNAVIESGQDPVIAHYLAPAGDKDSLQLPDGGVVAYTYREPGDYDDAGGGQTWHKIA